jgi:hypothetical protein
VFTRPCLLNFVNEMGLRAPHVTPLFSKCSSRTGWSAADKSETEKLHSTTKLRILVYPKLLYGIVDHAQMYHKIRCYFNLSRLKHSMSCGLNIPRSSPPIQHLIRLQIHRKRSVPNAPSSILGNWPADSSLPRSRHDTWKWKCLEKKTKTNTRID